jgi:Ca2+-dependent lipid-binding protein
MSTLPGFLSVRVLRGVNLVSCDAKGSDPYVVLSLDGQVCFFFPSQRNRIG